jgi:hypothetical protein
VEFGSLAEIPKAAEFRTDAQVRVCLEVAYAEAVAASRRQPVKTSGSSLGDARDASCDGGQGGQSELLIQGRTFRNAPKDAAGTHLPANFLMHLGAGWAILAEHLAFTKSAPCYRRHRHVIASFFKPAALSA